MLTIRGIYENGKVELLQKIQTTTKQRVLVTFVDDEPLTEEDAIRTISLEQNTTDLHDYLANEAEDLYQDFLKK